MSGSIQIPPFRDLPPGRLAQRTEHLLAEIECDGRSRGSSAPRRSWRSGRPGLRRLVVLAVALVLVVIGTASAIGAIRDLILDRGFVGLAPDKASPSSPEEGELVIAFLTPAPGDWGKSWFLVYADGRLVFDREAAMPEGANRFWSGWLERRLPPEKVEELRRDVLARVRPDSPGVPFGGLLYVRDAGRLVSVPAISGAADLTTRLVDPASWLPPSAQGDLEIRAYVPSEYAACWGTSPPSSDPSRILPLLPAAASELLRSRNTDRQPYGRPESPDGYDLCAVITAKEARGIVDALERSGLERGGAWHETGSPELTPDEARAAGWEGNYRLAYLFDSPHGGDGRINFNPVLPHGQYWIGK